MILICLFLYRLSSKKNSLAGQSEMSSDGSNSSRKENVPPELMICIDMNTGDESAGSNHDMQPNRTYSRKSRNNGIDHPSAWRSYDQEPLSSDQDSSVVQQVEPVPKFDVDPEVPLETMVALDQHASDQSAESDQTDNIKHNTGM